MPREEVKPAKKESHSPNASSNSLGSNNQNTTVLNSLDPNTANLLSAINGSTTSSATNNQSNNGNIQYFFAVPANGTNSNTSSAPVQFQAIQGLPNNIQGLQGLQGIQGLQGAQIILGSSNGQPTVFSVANRDN